MQVESYSAFNSFTPLGSVAAEANLQASSAAVESPSVPLRSSNRTEEVNSFPQKDAGQLEQVAKQIQDAIQDTNITLNFSRDEESGAIVVKWIDQASGEAIQQIPSETALRLAAVLGKLQGQFFNHKA
ncbi:MAG TPA: flagellar protein FlaG [Blastocatellia bacterium]|nr:flagellar protein FlaG [Blastocatellia bacterium]